ncbi:hypothetical protein ACD591_21170 [Rufibacter glacialis]|uniref:Uncharacterized protein n=1 Tax=Rufibacter glacialis TaxID=1259555 RepID=A0A5M8QU69_9BACT|nr:hypothetical protein [Rufibacter glacialis]KAA6438013.1 hypothetical protein FOE74_00840 [Rufibacter glacialis]GGK89628.1 hypothetical protein GCM10011405_41670 [Rufibacter glacialis]
MNKREEYGIQFFRRNAPFGGTSYDAETANLYDRELTYHISSSDKRITEKQIEALQKALNGEPIQEDWGEVLGSTLDIYPKEGTVQIGYMNRRIPIMDFKKLLEEWLDFIQS